MPDKKSKIKIQKSKIWRSQAGVAQLAIILLLLAGVALGTYLVQQKTHILPFAEERVCLKFEDDGSCSQYEESSPGNEKKDCPDGSQVNSNEDCPDTTSQVNDCNNKSKEECRDGKKVRIFFTYSDGECKENQPEEIGSCEADNTRANARDPQKECDQIDYCEGGRIVKKRATSIDSDSKCNYTFEKSSDYSDQCRVPDPNRPDQTTNAPDGTVVGGTQGQKSTGKSGDQLNVGSEGDNSEGIKKEACVDDPNGTIKPPGGYKWIAYCAQSCSNNSQCAQKSGDSAVNPNTSNWCYGGKCLKLVREDDKAEIDNPKRVADNEKARTSGVTLDIKTNKPDVNANILVLKRYQNELQQLQDKANNTALNQNDALKKIFEKAKALADQADKDSQACVNNPTPGCEDQVQEAFNAARTATRFAAFQAVLANVPDVCAKVDLGIQPYITAGGDRVFYCSKERGSDGETEKVWRTYDPATGKSRDINDPTKYPTNITSIDQLPQNVKESILKGQCVVTGNCTADQKTVDAASIANKVIADNKGKSASEVGKAVADAILAAGGSIAQAAGSASDTVAQLGGTLDDQVKASIGVMQRAGRSAEEIAQAGMSTAMDRLGCANKTTDADKQACFGQAKAKAIAQGASSTIDYTKLPGLPGGTSSQVSIYNYNVACSSTNKCPSGYSCTTSGTNAGKCLDSSGKPLAKPITP